MNQEGHEIVSEQTEQGAGTFSAMGSLSIW